MGLVSWVFTGLLSWQAGVIVREATQRNRAYGLAYAYSRDMGKPLLVVGGPYGTSPWLNWVPRHGPGDTCMDIVPEACAGAPRYVEADIRAMPFATGEFGAVFVSHVLEHLPTLEDVCAAWAELHRVADRVFALTPSKQNLYAHLMTTHHLWVEVQGDVLFAEDRRTGERLICTG